MSLTLKLMPKNTFADSSRCKDPSVSWRAHSNLAYVTLLRKKVDNMSTMSAYAKHLWEQSVKMVCREGRFSERVSGLSKSTAARATNAFSLWMCWITCQSPFHLDLNPSERVSLCQIDAVYVKKPIQAEERPTPWFSTVYILHCKQEVIWLLAKRS